MYMYQAPIPEEKFPVIGVTPPITGSIQATEVIKYVVGMGDLLTDGLLVYNGLKLDFREFKIKKNPHCAHFGHLSRKE